LRFRRNLASFPRTGEVRRQGAWEKLPDCTSISRRWTKFDLRPALADFLVEIDLPSLIREGVRAALAEAQRQQW